MKKHIKILAILSITLLLSVLLGQIVWLIKIREIKRNEFIKITNFSLSQCVADYLYTEMMNRNYEFACGLEDDGKTFVYGDGESMQINGLNEFLIRVR